MLGNVLRRIVALPTWVKALLVLVVLVVIGMSILLSPLVMVLAFLVLLVAIVAFFIQLLRQASPKRWAIVAVSSLVVLLVFTGISNALYFGGNAEQAASPPEPKREEPRSAPAETTAEETTAAPADKAVAAGKEDEASDEDDEDRGRYDAVATVDRVVDGDTVEVEPAVDGEEEVRLIGIDTPETKDPDEGVEPYGKEASNYAVSVLEGEEVELEFDEEREDQYGRLLAYVYPLGEEMFNEDLVSGGYAQVYTFPPNTKYEERFEAAQDEAKDANIGIWGLSKDEQCELADRGNGIGEGTTACQPKPDPAPEPEPEPEPQPEPPPVRDLDCSDFDSQLEAQETLIDDPSDPNGLDADGDGAACESSSGGSTASATATPTATATASPAPSPEISPPVGGDIDCDQVDGPIPTPPGDPDGLDGDGDGWACE